MLLFSLCFYLLKLSVVDTNVSQQSKGSDFNVFQYQSCTNFERNTKLDLVVPLISNFNKKESS